MPINTRKDMKNMFCKKCGKEIDGNMRFCPYCQEPTTNVQVNAPEQKTAQLRCLPSFILGLIGSIFGILGGVCTTMCTIGKSSNDAFLLIVGGSVIALIGACLCLNKAKLGSVLEVIGTLMIIFRAFSHGAEFMTVFAIVFLVLASLIGVVYSFFIKSK